MIHAVEGFTQVHKQTSHLLSVVQIALQHIHNFVQCRTTFSSKAVLILVQNFVFLQEFCEPIVHDSFV